MYLLNLWPVFGQKTADCSHIERPELAVLELDEHSSRVGVFDVSGAKHRAGYRSLETLGDVLVCFHVELVEALQHVIEQSCGASYILQQ